MSSDALTLHLRYSYFYPEKSYLDGITNGTITAAYDGFKEVEVVEDYRDSFTDVASLTDFVTKLTGIPASTMQIRQKGAASNLDLSDPGTALSALGLAENDVVVVQTLDFPGPYDFSDLTPEAQAALIKTYPQPAFGNDFGAPENQLKWAQWESNTADTNMYTGAANLATGDGYAAYSFTQQYFNPANPATPVGDVSVTKVISWNGMPGLLRNIRPFELQYNQADQHSDIGERVNQTEYCEWLAIKDAGGTTRKLVLTCEGPEYWQELFNTNPDECVRLYQELTGYADITAEDLIAKETIRIGGYPIVEKGQYNYYNAYNTTKGIVHLNQHNNFLSAELNIAVLSSQQQQDRDNQGNLTILQKALPLVLAGQYGSPGRNSDPTIGFVCNWIARHPLGLRLTIEPPVALYFGLLNTTGWEVPEGEISDWVKCTRGDASRDMGLRYEIAPPEGCDYTVEDVKIAGQPLRYGGQAARCMTVQLTGRAAAFSPGVAPPVRSRPAIRSAFQTADPISGETVGHILKDEAAPKLASLAGLAKKSRMPLTDAAAKITANLENAASPEAQTIVSGDIPPEYSPAEAAAKQIEAERQIVLDVDDIQGDPLVGFNTSHSIILSLDIHDVAATKAWLRDMAIPNITTTRTVIERHSHMRGYRDHLLTGAGQGIHTAAPDYQYMNIAFSNEGIALLTSDDEAEKFYAMGDAEAFSYGLPQRSTLLGDPPVNSGEKGARDTWLFGGERSPHIMVQCQADSHDAVEALAQEMAESFQGMGAGIVVFADKGHRREGAAEKPKEQFGFHDGISNPGVRGMYEHAPQWGVSKSYLDRRDIDKSDPRWNTYSKPGTHLVWPGEIILGQPKQRNLQGANPPQHYLLPGDDHFPGPDWAKNGTFAVYRRLRQDVAAFWNHAKAGAEAMNTQFGTQDAATDWDPTKMASRFIGRWPSGCPIMLSPDADHPSWGYNKMTQNAFNYATPTPPFPAARTEEPVDGVPTQPEDNIGLRCPMGSHVRKVNPRDQGTDFGPDEDTLTHRFIRRGTPYGDFVPEDQKFEDDGQDRGLQFIAYMASIDLQFEFVIRFWANVNQQPVAMTAGRSDDMVIGQTSAVGYDRALTALELNKDGLPAVATTPSTKDRWVTATGGGYYFMPSITALQEVISA